MDSKIPHGIVREVDPKTGEYLKEVVLSTDDKGRPIETTVKDMRKDLKAISDPVTLDKFFSTYDPEQTQKAISTRPNGGSSLSSSGGNRPTIQKLNKNPDFEIIDDPEFQNKSLKHIHAFGNQFFGQSAA